MILHRDNARLGAEAETIPRHCLSKLPQHEDLAKALSLSSAHVCDTVRDPNILEVEWFTQDRVVGLGRLESGARPSV
jgi:hypothetical protein